MFETIRPRPLLQVSLALVAGSAAFILCGNISLFLLAGLAAVAGLWRAWWPMTLCALAAGAGGLASGQQQAFTLDSPVRFDTVNEASVLEGRLDWPVGANRWKVHLETQNSEPVEADIMVTLPRGSSFGPGDRIEIRGRVNPVEPAYGRRLQVYANVTAFSVHLRAPSDTPSRALVYRVRSQMETAYRRSMDPQAAKMTTAIVFGDPGSVPMAIRDNMKRTGVYHLLAASGLNVAILGILVNWIFSLLPLPRFASVFACILILIAYALAAGAAPAVMRATVAMIIYVAAPIVRRPSDALTALGAGGIYQVLTDPSAVMDAGFQLSYFAAGGLILWMPAINRWLGQRIPSSHDRLSGQVLRWVATAAATTFVATLASGPLIAYHFGRVPTLSVIGDLLCAPFVAPCLIAGLIGPMLAFVPGWQPLWLAGIAAPCANWIAAVSSTIGGLSWSSVLVPLFSPIWLAPYYLLFIGLAREPKREVA